MKRFFVPFFMFFCLIAISCERSKREDSSTLRFRVPDIATSVSSQKMSGEDPNGLADINCYGILVSGPEDRMKRNRCYKEESPASSIFTVGVVRAGIPAGAEISMDVPPGEDRNIKLVGFKTTNGYCYDWINSPGNSHDEYVSKPFILGEAKGVSLAPGTTKEIDMSLSFDSSNWFDECIGPEFDNGGSNSLPPAKVSLKKNNFPQDFFRKTSASSIFYACEEFEVYATDINDRRAFFSIDSTPVTVLLRSSTTTPATQFYSSSSDCSSGSATGIISSVNLSSSASSQRFWARADNFSESSITLFATPTTSLTAAQQSYSAYAYSAITFKLTLPDQLVPGGCYAGKIERTKLDGTPSSGSATSIQISPGNANLKVYADAACTTEKYVSSTTASDLLYFKILTGTSGSISLSISGDSGALTINRSVSVAPGSLTPARYRVVGWNRSPTNVCGPDTSITTQLINEKESIVPVPTGATYHFSINYPVADQLKYSCGGTPFSSGADATLNEGNYSFSLYMQTRANPSLVEQLIIITPTDAGSSLGKGFFRYLIKN